MGAGRVSAKYEAMHDGYGVRSFQNNDEEDI
jgi:hypothetical protein